MSLPREEVLKALELWPVWRPRQGAAAEPAELSMAPTAAEPLPQAEPPPATTGPAAATPVLAGHPAVAQMDWSALEAAVQACQACSLAQTRTQTVFGVGDRNADWLIVGEAPGAEEDRRGEPFVGQRL